MIHHALDSITLPSRGCDMFTENLLKGLKPDEDRCESLIEGSLAMCTSRVPVTGYDKSAARERCVQAGEDGEAARPRNARRCRGTAGDGERKWGDSDERGYRQALGPLGYDASRRRRCRGRLTSSHGRPSVGKPTPKLGVVCVFSMRKCAQSRAASMNVIHRFMECPFFACRLDAHAEGRNWYA